MSQYCYTRYDADFSKRAKEMGRSIIIAGENYGQGSSREHAAINPMYLGVKCVVAKSIARIHKGNLINHGIIPMLFENNEDYDRIELGDELEIRDLPGQIPTRKITISDNTKGFKITISDNTKGFAFEVRLECTDNELEVVLAGGQLRFLKKQLKEMGVETA